jgi:valyl-tRNA synthetase
MEKKYNNSTAHADANHLWEEQNIYEKNLKYGTGPLFTVDTPPPTVSGTLHIGHVFSYTHTDIIARYKRMTGYRVFYPFGFDDNGLPTERFVEKKREIRAGSMKQSEFQKICLEESHKAAEQFKALWKKLGLSANFKQTYSTISGEVQKISQASFLKLLEKKLVYRNFEPAIYCSTCRTSVSQAELDDITKETTFYTFEFCKDTTAQKPLLVATTRPELLWSCVGLLFHPSDTRYTHLQNTHVTVALSGHTVSCFGDEKVDPTKGTGLVMVCTFGDKTDIEWYKKYKLPYINSIGHDGKMTRGIAQGLSVATARQKVVEQMKTEQLIIDEKKITHTVGVHERCKNPIEYLCFAQWFVSIIDRKKEFLSFSESITWNPHFMKSRFLDWVQNLGWDWCISRQRPYGIPFPVWHCLSCNTVIPADLDQLPINPQETTAPSCTKCGSHRVAADTDVMDTWNTSSLSPYIIYDLYCSIMVEQQGHLFEKPAPKEFFPLSIRPQAHDIIRTWAFDTIVKSFLHNDPIPWNNIVISGHVLSDQKEKISKSKGNENYTPERLLTDFDSDAIRYWAAHSSLGHDSAFSVDQIKQGQRLITKLWNAFLFAQPHLNESVHTTPREKLSPINQWIIDSFHAMTKSYSEYFKAYETGPAITVLERFFWSDYCDNYIEIVKNILFNPELYTKEERDQTLWTIYHIGFGILQQYAPFMPYITETLYQQLYRVPHNAVSIHITQMIAKLPVILDQKEIEHGLILIQIAEKVRKLKTEQQLSLKTELANLTIVTNDKALSLMIEQQSMLIKGVTQAATIQVTNPSTEQTRIIQIENKMSAFVIIE